MLHLLRVEYLHKLLEILLHGRFVSSLIFINLFNFLFIAYGLMDVSSILWVIIQYYFIAQIFSALATGGSFS